MKKTIFNILVLLLSLTVWGQDQKVINDCTVTYDISIADAKADATLVTAMQGATKVVYLRSNKVRTDFITSSFLQTTLLDSKADTVVVLREFDNNKFISFLDKQKRLEQAKKFAGITFSNTTEKKVILGFQCIKTIATLSDGSTYNVYYAPSIIPSNNTFEMQFKDIPGFVLEYEAKTDDGKIKIKYTASKISLIPVPVVKFEVPQSGYRVL